MQVNGRCVALPCLQTTPGTHFRAAAQVPGPVLALWRGDISYPLPESNHDLGHPVRSAVTTTYPILGPKSVCNCSFHTQW
jgi:hypothetical protein